MIKLIGLENFQSHIRTELEFHPNMNSIVGLSDSGKSSIIRSMNTLLKASPFYLTKRTTEGNVYGQVNNHNISRKRIETVLTKCPSCKEKFPPNTQLCPSCGELINGKTAEDKYNFDGNTYFVSMAEEIFRQLKIQPIEFGDDEFYLNFASQHDDMFFIGKSFSGPTRNRMISALCNDSEKVDSTIKSVRSEISQLKSKFELLTEENIRIEEIDTILSPVVLEVKELQKENTELGTQISNYNSEIFELEDLKSKLESKKAIEQIKKLVAVGNALDKLKVQVESVNKVNDSILVLSSIQNTIQKYCKSKSVQIQDIKIELEDLNIDSEIKELLSIQKILKNNIKSKSIQPIKVDFDYQNFDNISSDVKELFDLKEEVSTKSIVMQEIGIRLSEIEETKKELKIILEKKFKNDIICPISKLPYEKNCMELLLKNI